MAGAETSACEELYGIRDRILSNDMELSCSFRRNNHRIIGYSVKMWFWQICTFLNIWFGIRFNDNAIKMFLSSADCVRKKHRRNRWQQWKGLYNCISIVSCLDTAPQFDAKVRRSNRTRCQHFSYKCRHQRVNKLFRRWTNATNIRWKHGNLCINSCSTSNVSLSSVINTSFGLHQTLCLTFRWQ